MSDVLTIEDLQAAKKHDTFHSEVITGKAGGLSTGPDIDTATNAVTGQTQKTLPKVLRDLGMMVQTWTATTGGTLTDASQVFLNDITASAGKGNCYAWTGAFPKVVAPGTDPAAVAGFVMRSDAGLRSELSGDGGSAMVGFKLSGLTQAIQRTVQDKLSDSISLLDFAVGDGVTDDSDAIQTAILLCPSGAWLDGVGRVYKVTKNITSTDALYFKLKNANFVTSSDYSTQGKFSITSLVTRLHGITVDGGRGTYKTGLETWKQFGSFGGYGSIEPTLPDFFSIVNMSESAIVDVDGLTMYNMFCRGCLQAVTLGTVFLDRLVFKNVANKTYHIYHSQDDGVTQGGRTIVGTVVTDDVGLLPSSFLVDGATTSFASATVAPQGSFNCCVSFGDYIMHDAAIGNYGSCAITADRNKTFTCGNAVIKHDSVMGWSNNPSGAFWLENVGVSNVGNLYIEITDRDSRDYALDSSALQIFITDDGIANFDNIEIKCNETSAKLRRAIRTSSKNQCNIKMKHLDVHGLFVANAVNFGQLPNSAIGTVVRIDSGYIQGDVGFDSTQSVKLGAVTITGAVGAKPSGNPGITGSPVSLSIDGGGVSSIGGITNTLPFTGALSVCDTLSVGTVTCGTVVGDVVMRGNKSVNGAVTVASASSVKIDGGNKLKNTTIIKSAANLNFVGNETERRLEIKDVKVFNVFANNIKTASAESAVWVNPVSSSSVLAGVITGNNVLIKTGTSGAGYVTIGSGVTGVIDVNNNKLTVAW